MVSAVTKWAVLRVVLSPPISTVIGLLAAAATARTVYTDEASLLSGWANLDLARSSASDEWLASPDGSCAEAESSGEKIVRRLDELDLKPMVHAGIPGNCSCASISAIVRAVNGDGTEAIVLAVQAGTGTDVTVCREVAVALRLATHLSHAAWLSKDIVLLVHPRCPCGRPPLRRFLHQYQMLETVGTAGGGGDVAAALRVRRAGVLRQVLTLSAAQPPVAPEDAAVATSVHVELHGALGRLPNLDLCARLNISRLHLDLCARFHLARLHLELSAALCGPRAAVLCKAAISTPGSPQPRCNAAVLLRRYSVIWTVAAHSDVRVPLHVPATWPLGTAEGDGGGGGDGAAVTPMPSMPLPNPMRWAMMDHD